MGRDHSLPPDGLEEHTPKWHFGKFVEFTRLKGEIGEPSPHLAIVGHMSEKMSMEDRLWLLGCYAATYCLPTAEVIWEQYSPEDIRVGGPKQLEDWLTEHWKGIVTRTERRCVRSPKKMRECLVSLVHWMDYEFPDLHKNLVGGEESRENYDTVWESVEKIKYFGRYINIRFVEGLRRYCGVPARLYDIRSIGGWSPKRCLCYLYPDHTEALLKEGKEGDALTDELAMELLGKVQKQLPKVDEYILAAMLCEWKGAFENRHQYPAWTLDQEPLLYDKVFAYWGSQIDKKALWNARKAIFPHEALGEIGNRWYGTRWECAAVARDFGYNWSDLDFDYVKTLKSGDFSKPVLLGD